MDHFEKLKAIHKILCDPSISSIRLVMNPEKMVIQETRRAYTYLQMYGYGVDAVIINRILKPQQGNDSGWERYYEAQKKYVEEIENSFSPLPIFKVLHQQQEVFGLRLLELIGKEIYKTKDPTRIFYKESTYKIEFPPNHW